MTSVEIETLIQRIFPESREKFTTHIHESIEAFKIKYLEVFGTSITDDHIRLIPTGFGGYKIYSKDGFNEEFLVNKPIPGKNGLEINWSGYRDVYFTSVVPEFPYRQVDTIYMNGKRVSAIEYNIDGAKLMEIEWDEDNNHNILLNRSSSRSYHAPRAFIEIENQILNNIIQRPLTVTTAQLPAAPDDLIALLTGRASGSGASGCCEK